MALFRSGTEERTDLVHPATTVITRYPRLRNFLICTAAHQVPLEDGFSIATFRFAYASWRGLVALVTEVAASILADKVSTVALDAESTGTLTNDDRSLELQALLPTQSTRFAATQPTGVALLAEVLLCEAISHSLDFSFGCLEHRLGSTEDSALRRVELESVLEHQL